MHSSPSTPLPADPSVMQAAGPTDTLPTLSSTSRPSLSSSPASGSIPPFGRTQSAATTVVSLLPTGTGRTSSMSNDFGMPTADLAPAIPTLQHGHLYAAPATLADTQDQLDGEALRPTTTSTLMLHDSDSNGPGQRTRYTTAATSASNSTAVVGQRNRGEHGQRDSTGGDQHTQSHSPSSASITLFDHADTIRPGHHQAPASQQHAEYQPLSLPKRPNAAPALPAPAYGQKHASTFCSIPLLQRFVPRSRSRRIACCACFILVFAFLSVGIYIAVTLSSLVPPKLDFLRTSAPSPPRQPVAIDMNGPVVTIQWDLVVSIANANSIPIELYDIQFAGYSAPPPTGASNTSHPSLASGNLSTMALPARINGTTPSRSEWLVPVTIPWRVRDAKQNAFLVDLLTACNAPKTLVPNGATVKSGDKVRLWYRVDAGVERLRWFAGGYRHKHEAWAEFACPVNLSDVPGMKEVASVVGTVGEVLGNLLQNDAIPDVHLPSLPSLFGQ